MNENDEMQTYRDATLQMILFVRIQLRQVRLVQLTCTQWGQVPNIQKFQILVSILKPAFIVGPSTGITI